MFDDALKAGDTPRAEIIGCRFFTLVINKFKCFSASARPHPRLHVEALCPRLVKPPFQEVRRRGKVCAISAVCALSPPFVALMSSPRGGKCAP